MGRRKVRSRESRTSKSESRILERKEEEEEEEEENGEIVGDVPIDVYARLTYPLVSTCFSRKSDEDEDDDEDEESVELNVRPRFVFVSSLCAVCLQKRRMFCEGCRMVSYCSAAHRSKGLAEHGELCEALAEIRSSIVSTLESEESKIRLDAEQYRAYRVQLLAVLQSKIRRPLKLWEKEIVLYPMICRLCRRFREDLICCPNCGMECYCVDHATDHEKWCKEFETLQRCLLLQWKHGCVNPMIPNVRRQMVLAKSRDLTFHELMHRIYGNCLYYREMDCYTYSVLSQVCTIPLTALYAMQISCRNWQSKSDFTIHILGAEFQFEGINLHAWEKLFLHFLPNLKRVRVVLVGPELRLPSGVPVQILSKVNLCRQCKSAGRSVLVNFRPGMLYHELISKSTSEGHHPVTEPDLICAFNPGLYRKTGFAGQDSWFQTIREFSRRTSAVAITSYTVDEMFWEIARIKSITDVDVLLEPRENPFASIKPDRNFVTDHSNPLIYKNYYISIVRGKLLPE
ncbi:uncharacterized protein LOC117608336 [Osmia lignaria lignaria]|uniref:uncharacterized protein LOC117608336 n=1 Tax=Osmia lignaria lignaria TaxID=1437193 RepID=UPI00402BF12E